MAIIRRQSDRVRRAVAAHCLVGRSRSCTLRIDLPRVSAEHASIRWFGTGWKIRDLGSSNGTRVDQRLIPTGRFTELKVGQEVIFGDSSEVWEIECLAPPGAVAFAIDNQDFREMVDGMLCIPTEEEPIAVVRRGSVRKWLLEIDGDSKPVQDGDQLTVNGVAWRLDLPDEPAQATDEGTGVGPSSQTRFGEVELELKVSADHDDVAVRAHVAGSPVDLGVRSCFYLLYMLAKARASEPDSGWVSTEDLISKLYRDFDANHLNVDIFRVRKAVRQANIPDANAVIERRTGHVRLGTNKLRISGL